MKVTQAALEQNSVSKPALYMATELGVKDWKFAFGGPLRDSQAQVSAPRIGAILS